MKKYVKPELFCESFELAQHIAACAFDSNGTQDSVEKCSFTGDSGFGIVNVFQSKPTCEAKGDDYCYTNGSGGLMNLFNS